LEWISWRIVSAMATRKPGVTAKLGAQSVFFFLVANYPAPLALGAFCEGTWAYARCARSDPGWPMTGRWPSRNLRQERGSAIPVIRSKRGTFVVDEEKLPDMEIEASVVQTRLD